MTNSHGQSSHDDMSAYLQVYLDETDEELESLVQSLLILEREPKNKGALNEAFRMLHSLKGSSGMMGFEGINQLAHHLENRFDKIRAGSAELTRPVMDLMLDCLDFFRKFVISMRASEQANQDGSQLIKRLEEIDHSMVKSAAPMPGLVTMGGGFKVRITFQEGLQLVDLKAKLIIARLSNIGEIIGSEPALDDIHSFDEIVQFVVIIASEKDPEEIKKIANVDGVVKVEINPGQNESTASAEPEEFFLAETVDLLSPTMSPQTNIDSQKETLAEVNQTPTALTPTANNRNVPEEIEVNAEAIPPSDPGKQHLSETVRVDINRLDRLMNLTGELVVTNARFKKISADLNQSLRGIRGSGMMLSIVERLREGLENIRTLNLLNTESAQSNRILDEVDLDLNELEQDAQFFDAGRKHFTQISEAVDQLSRVSKNLQKGVLDTRMVPVGPLFSRFKRVIRDLSHDREKNIQLLIKGEKTELDKRMIDELGDPLLHLIRNSIDHGLEPPATRIAAGKSEMGTIALEAYHSGNNVLISIQDDGRGIDTDKVRKRVVERGLADAEMVRNLTDEQVIEYIWHPGFSTAEQITDISGRGVGMDIVKNCIADLNGTIKVITEKGQGTNILLRLPLTLAIIRSLIVRYRQGHFSIPIDEVREIVAFPAAQIHTIHGQQTIDVRGQYIPLTSLAQLFHWNEQTRNLMNAQEKIEGPVNIVIVQSRGIVLGLCVDELLGGSDIVIKSLSDNFTSIKGLSGASIMGDGNVCLMLDTSALIELMQH